MQKVTCHLYLKCRSSTTAFQCKSAKKPGHHLPIDSVVRGSDTGRQSEEVVSCLVNWKPVDCWNVAMAMIFRRWLQRLFDRSEMAWMSSGDRCFDCFRWESNTNVFSTSSGHCRPHLHVPSFSRYCRTSSCDRRQALDGLSETTCIYIQQCDI